MNIFKGIKIIFFLILLYNLIGCVTVQTNIDDRDDYYAISLETKRRFILFFDYVMEKYRAEDRSGNKIFEGDSGRILFREFNFFEGNTQISRIEIIQRETKGVIFTTIRRFIKFTDNNNRGIEYEVKGNIEGNYLTIQDEIFGIIEFNYFMTNGFHTGFDIIVNNERYGILAFYPDSFRSGFIKPALFLKKENELNNKIALYIMTVYLNYNTKF